MRRPLVVIAWLLLVVACSTGVWAVISSAGQGVTTSREIPQPVPVPSSAPGSTGPATSPPHPSTSPPRPSSSPTAGASRDESTPPSRPRTDPPPSTGAPSPGPSRPRSDSEVRRTWDGPAGSVVVGCRGATITFRGAQANSGWSVEVRERGPDEVDVRFESSGDADDVRVEAECVDGQPRFSD